MEKKKEMLISILLEMLLAGVKEVQVQLEGSRRKKDVCMKDPDRD